MARWIEIPLDGHPGRKLPTWGTVAERYNRCFGRAAFYVAQRIHDSGAFERIASEALEANPDLLVGDQDDLEEVRRLRVSVDRLIGTHPAP